MPGRASAPESGKMLEQQVAAVAERLGLRTDTQVRVGRRIWGAERRIDIIVSGPEGKRLGVECKFQGSGGSAEEKIPVVIDDINAWPIDGIVVFEGDGFSPHMRGFLLSTGKAVQLDDLDVWLRLYFGLPLEG